MATTTIEPISGAIHFTGLGSGTDFDTIVEKLIEIESIQKARMEAWRTTWEDKITSIQGLNARVASVKSYMESIDTFDEFYSRVASSSDTDVLTVTANNDAGPGTHQVEIASSVNHRLASKGVNGSSFAVGSDGNNLVITVGSTVVTVSYAAAPVHANGQYNENSTLAQLATAIDAADATFGDNLYDVEIIDDGSDTNMYRLMMTARATGESNAITISGTSAAGGGDPTGLGMTGTNIDDVELKTWSGTSTVGSAGTYTGATNKTFHFKVAQSATVSSANFTVAWTDDEGNNGTFTVSAAGPVSVYQGVTVSFSGGGTVVASDTFTIDVFAPDLQKAADNGLAQADQHVHSGFADLDVTYVHTGASTATFAYSYGGITETVDVTQNTTLGQLVNLINNSSTNPGVTATIINDGMGLPTSYHLVLTGDQTGAARVITNVTETLDNFSGGTSDWTNTTQAQNAAIKIDGYPPETYSYLQRATNLVSDVIDGVTMTLKSTGTSQVTITDDKSAIKSKINTFVSSVNFVLDYIQGETKYDEDTGSSGTMIGNYAFDIVKRRLSDILYTSIPGLTDGVDTYTVLSQIGIKTNTEDNGRWYVETSDLDAALDNDLEAVARLFVHDTVKDSLGTAYRLAQEADDLTDSTDGPMNILIKNYGGIIDDINDRIERETRRIKTVRERLEAQFARLEATLARLDKINSYLESQIGQLPGIGTSNN